MHKDAAIQSAVNAIDAHVRNLRYLRKPEAAVVDFETKFGQALDFACCLSDDFFAALPDDMSGNDIARAIYREWFGPRA